MLPALLLLVLAVLGPAAARRHAPDLREDEPARRTTRPAGECCTQRSYEHASLVPMISADVIKCTSIILIYKASPNRGHRTL